MRFLSPPMKGGKQKQESGIAANFANFGQKIDNISKISEISNDSNIFKSRDFVQCGRCVNFIPVIEHSVAGIGECRLEGYPLPNQVPAYPFARRYCDQFKERKQ